MNLHTDIDLQIMEEEPTDLRTPYVVVRGWGLSKPSGLWVAKDERIVEAACAEFAVLAYTLRHGQSTLETQAYTPDEYLALRDRLHQARIHHIELSA